MRMILRSNSIKDAVLNWQLDCGLKAKSGNLEVDCVLNVDIKDDMILR